MLEISCLQLLFEMDPGRLAEEEDRFPPFPRWSPRADTFAEVIDLLRRTRARGPGAAASRSVAGPRIRLLRAGAELALLGAARLG